MVNQATNMRNMRIMRMIRMAKSMKRKRKIQRHLCATLWYACNPITKPTKEALAYLELRKRLKEQLRKKKSGSSLAIEFIQNGILVWSWSCRAHRGRWRTLEMDESERGIWEIRACGLN
ncbi:SPT2-like protein [Pyrus ussuriensis x Pyrus communis]|uniref:SPT2-like protein n=1 Tax=Pyrus ussuriensis x Pyrus communis TaxID=2448454 RepID=A0A5N5FXQ8_9ROSA|nr:SPT2-like protein [Pyrus ussuriensis x Pyrus communis]